MTSTAKKRDPESGDRGGVKYPDQARELAQIMERTGLSKEGLSDVVGLKLETLRKYVQGHQKAGTQTMQLIREKTNRVTPISGTKGALTPRSKMIADISDSGGPDDEDIIHEDPPPYGAESQTARILSDRTIADIISEITGNEEIPAEERLRRVKPFQDELQRRIKGKS